MKRVIFWIASFFLAIPVTLWAWYHERRILRRGRELSNAEIQDARTVGVRQPERLRILAVERVPNPLIRLSGIIERLTKFSIFAPAGMTLRYGIFVVASLERDRLLLAHEFVHVAQYERLGGRFGLLRRYVFQCLADGYLVEAASSVGASPRGTREISRWCNEERVEPPVSTKAVMGTLEGCEKRQIHGTVASGLPLLPLPGQIKSPQRIRAFRYRCTPGYFLSCLQHLPNNRLKLA